MKISQSTTQYFRYFDGLLYNSSYGALTDVSLPTSQEIQAGFLEKSDTGVKLYADRVPQGIRTLSWNMLNATMGTQLQQRDSEDNLTWQMRKSAGQWGLATMRSALFDIDYGEGEGYLASGRQPLRGRLQLRPRHNSGLIKDLQDLSSGRSRFAPLLRDDAGASIHLCAALPPEGKETFLATHRWLQKEMENAPAGHDGAAYSEIVNVLADIAEDGTVEAIVRLAHSEASGSVILGGLQVGHRSGLLDSIEHAAQGEFGSDANFVVEHVQRYGRPLVHIQNQPGDRDVVRISDVWIAAGGENAHEMIRIAADRCGKGGRVVHTRLLTAKIDLDDWLSWPEDDATGLSRLPLKIDGNEALNPLRWMIPIGAFGNDTTPPTPVLEKLLAAERSDQKQAWLTLTADKRGLAAEAELGRVLADFWAARMIDARDRMMQMSRDAMQVAEDAAASAADASPEVSPDATNETQPAAAE